MYTYIHKYIHTYSHVYIFQINNEDCSNEKKELRKKSIINGKNLNLIEIKNDEYISENILLKNSLKEKLNLINENEKNHKEALVCIYMYIYVLYPYMKEHMYLCKNMYIFIEN
jgi:hypothetical protein